MFSYFILPACTVHSKGNKINVTRVELLQKRIQKVIFHRCSFDVPLEDVTVMLNVTKLLQPHSVTQSVSLNNLMLEHLRV